MPLRARNAALSVLAVLLGNLPMVSAMTYKKTLIAALGAVALFLAAGETFAEPGPARGAGVAPARPAFPSFPRHHGRGAVSFPGPEVSFMVWRTRFASLSSKRRRQNCRTTSATPAYWTFPGTTSIAVRNSRRPAKRTRRHHPPPPDALHLIDVARRGHGRASRSGRAPVAQACSTQRLARRMIRLGKHRPHDLQADRQPLDKSARHRGCGLAGEVERPCQRRPVEPLREARGVGRVDAGRERGDRNGRRQQQVVIRRETTACVWLSARISA